MSAQVRQLRTGALEDVFCSSFSYPVHSVFPESSVSIMQTAFRVQAESSTKAPSRNMPRRSMLEWTPPALKIAVCCHSVPRDGRL
eukprot:395384-Amphidinium_carterae.3